MYCESISGTIYTERSEGMTYTRDEIIALYDKLESIRAVAKETGLSHSTIRQILVDSGIYPSALTKSINQMHQYGVSEAEIAEILNISVKAVRVHLPHTKGSYACDKPTKNAIRIRRNRKKKKEQTE